MEMEAISNVNANYGTTEVVRTTPKTTTGEVVNVDSPNPALDVVSKCKGKCWSAGRQ